MGQSSFGSQFAPLATLNQMAAWPTLGGGTGAVGAALPQWTNPFDVSLSSLLYGLPGPVPAGLSQFGTQSSLFGDLTGLGNPGLLPLLLLLANRPVTTVPFENPVQTGSPDAQWGVYPWNGGLPYYPAPGTTLPNWAAPPLGQVPPVPGGASNLPGRLPDLGHGPFSPGGGEGGGEGGGGGGEGGWPWGDGWSMNSMMDVTKGLYPDQQRLGPDTVYNPGANPMTPVMTVAPTLEEVMASPQYQEEKQRTRQSGGGSIAVRAPDGTTYMQWEPEKGGF